jgi:hypothetical protein
MLTKPPKTLQPPLIAKVIKLMAYLPRDTVVKTCRKSRKMIKSAVEAGSIIVA